MIKYGLISETDARCLEKTIDLICNKFKDEVINVLEIGIYSGETGRGIAEYIKSKGRNCWITGIDNGKDNENLKFPYNKLIYGNSTEVYSQIQDNSQHLILFDGDHSLIGVIGDFFAYSNKVKIKGYLAFHDTGKHIKPFKDFQHGDKNNPDAYISVRKALDTIGMFNDAGYDLFQSTVSERYVGNYGFVLAFDEADENNEAGGMIVFSNKKQINELYESYFGGC